MTGKPGQTMLTTVQAGALLMVTDRWVRDLSRKGYIPAPVDGKVPLVGAVQGYIRWLKDEERRTSKTAAASQVQQARAREIELRIAREAGELLQREDVEAFCADALALFRSALGGIPTAATRDIALRLKIETLLNDALAGLEMAFSKYDAPERLNISPNQPPTSRGEPRAMARRKRSFAR